MIVINPKIVLFFFVDMLDKTFVITAPCGLNRQRLLLCANNDDNNMICELQGVTLGDDVQTCMT